MSLQLLPLSLLSNNLGESDFIANKTKRNYINLKGINEKEVHNCVKNFMVLYEIWSQTDEIIMVKKPLKYKPDNYHDISFTLVFYNMYRQTCEKRPMFKPVDEIDNNVSDDEIVPEEIDDINLLETEINTEDLKHENINSEESDNDVKLIKRKKKKKKGEKYKKRNYNI